MTIEAKVIADSISPGDVRLTTMQLKYPRFIHSELMTHRAFSRNASSSRAIPVKRMIADVLADPAMPVHWGKNQAGMQADGELTEEDALAVRAEWMRGMYYAVERAERMARMGAHKQIVNRVLEPYQHIRVVVTATDWANFFALRDHEDAQPEIRALAQAMRAAMGGSEPQRLEVGYWHLPYVTEEDRYHVGLNLKKLCRISAARCARVSYLKHDGANPSITEDEILYERLAGSMPIHASPLEHQATPLEDPTERSGNFRGWLQFRKTLEGECVYD